MDAVDLARWQFGITTVYHFFFVPLTIGLSGVVALFQTIWVVTKNDAWLKLTKFFGTLFLINFAMGIVTGIVQEFQFGMNWSEYSRFVGDIFGAPLALEALLAFFLESTFLGLWIFGWNRLPRGVHLACIWIASAGTVLSAYFILAANSFMQHPVGYTMNAERGRAELNNFLDVLTNPVVLATFPHQIFACYMVAGAFVAAVAGWWWLRSARALARGEQNGGAHAAASSDAATVAANSDATSRAAHRSAMRIGAAILLVAGLGVIVSGDFQAKVMYEVQPMKMSAAEAHYDDTGEPADFSLITIGSLDGSREVFSIKVPYLLSFLAHGNFSQPVEGINDIQRLYEQQYGPGTYSPNVPLAYWTFRLMMGLGLLSMVIGAAVLFVTRRERAPLSRWWTPALVVMPLAVLFANSFGWIFTETGRQPWIVFGLMPTSAGVSPGTPAWQVGLSLVGFTLLYGALAIVEVWLLLRVIREGLHEADPDHDAADHDDELSLAY